MRDFASYSTRAIGFPLHCSVSIFELELVEVNVSIFIGGVLHVDQRLKVVMPRGIRHGRYPME